MQISPAPNLTNFLNLYLLNPKYPNNNFQHTDYILRIYENYGKKQQAKASLPEMKSEQMSLPLSGNKSWAKISGDLRRRVL